MRVLSYGTILRRGLKEQPLDSRRTKARFCYPDVIEPFQEGLGSSIQNRGG
jgi:hypothetical protein